MNTGLNWKRCASFTAAGWGGGKWSAVVERKGYMWSWIVLREMPAGGYGIQASGEAHGYLSAQQDAEAWIWENVGQVSSFGPGKEANEVKRWIVTLTTNEGTEFVHKVEAAHLWAAIQLTVAAWNEEHAFITLTQVHGYEV